MRFFIATISNPKPFFKDTFMQSQSKILAFFKDTFAQGIENGDFKKDLNVKSAIVAFISIVNFPFLFRSLKPFHRVLMSLKMSML
mgnify:FL=1